MTNSYLSVDVKAFKGQQTFSVELLDRSAPSFFEELNRQMSFALAKAQDAYVVTQLGAGATDGGNRTMSAANLQDFVADAAASIYTNSLGFAQALIVSPEQWAAIMGLIDGSNRPVYVASQPSNAAGALAPTRARGQVLGLDLYVDRNMSGTGDETIFAVNPESYTWYEGSSTTLRTDVIGSGQIEVALVNYGACARKVNAGAYKWMVA